MLYVSLSGGVVQEAFVAALDARDVPLTHLLRPADAAAELVAWIRERSGRRRLALHGYDHTRARSATPADARASSPACPTTRPRCG